MKHLIILSLTTCSLIACSTPGQKPVTEPVQEIPTGQPVEIIDDVEAVKKPVFEMKPVVVSLLKKAGNRIDVEDYDSAANFLERGISISPNNPFLWQKLAAVRLKQGDFQQAEQLAVKSNVLGEADDELRLRNWKIIAEAKKLQKASID